MSRSIHTTFKKNIRGLTKNELFEQYDDPNSDLAALANKLHIKKEVKRNRKQKKSE